MISYLKGIISYKLKNTIIVEVNNIGYSVFVSENFFNELKVGQELQLFTHQYVREEALDLYGFKTLEELEFFELLISISGIGPKSALSVLAIAKLSDIKESIVRGDSHLLTKVSGIGKKIAERVVLELKDKLFKMGGDYDLSSGGGFSADEIDALMVLGYSLPEAREALNQVDKDVVDSGQRIREALKKLSKN
ncbi:MAG: Holliday junction branch migration protein RuvA [Patescibacteria group bacterium]|nr:Holliday junction branch migration protein RuvA [Patescibacteria group bacterium]